MNAEEMIRCMRGEIRASLDHSLGWDGEWNAARGQMECSCKSCGAPDYEQHEPDCPVDAAEKPLRRALEKSAAFLAPMTQLHELHAEANRIDEERRYRETA